MREFNNGAIRSSSNGKIDWFGIYEPLVENTYGKYMMKHQITEDGTKRETFNWWGGWDKLISLQSMTRHLQDLHALEAGYRVFKERINKDGEWHETTHYLKNVDVVPSNYVEVDKTETVCAIRFNCNSYLLDIIK